VSHPPWNYGAFEGSFPAVFTDVRSFVLFDARHGWRELHPAEVLTKVRTMSRADFDDAFPDLPVPPT
jgi:hypothetical protein